MKDYMNRIEGLIFFGDSIFAGTGASDRQLGCAKLVKKHLQIPISIQSRNRDTSKDALQRIAIDVLGRREYSHVLVLFGNNDCWFERGSPRIPVNEFGQNVTQIIQMIKDNGQAPLVCTLQPIDTSKFLRTYPDYSIMNKLNGLDPHVFQGRYSKMVESICRAKETTLIDIRAAMELTVQEVMASDGVHPNNSGHEIIAEAILRTLQLIDPHIGLMKPAI